MGETSLGWFDDFYGQTNRYADPPWRERREQYLREVGSSADLTYFTSNPHISGDGMSAVDNIVG